MDVQDARVALQAAIQLGNPQLIQAARAALATAENGEDESVDGRKAKGKAKGKAKAEEEPHEEPDGDEEPTEDEGDAEDAEGSEDAEESEGEDEAVDAEYSEDAEDAEEAEEGKAKMKKGSKAAGASMTRLLAALGARNVAQAIGRATAAAEAMRQVEALAKRVKKMEAKEKGAKLDKLFAAAVRDGRVTRAEIAHLKPLYRGRPLAEAEAYLSAKPRVASVEYARESAAHYPSAPVVAGVNLHTPNAQKAMAAFGVSPEQVAQRASERGMTTNFPGGAK